MRKRIFPALLAFVLLLSMVPVAFATPMTLVLETVGDTNKEFVYYITANNAYIDLDQEKEYVERINNVRRNICNCGFTVFAFQENANDIYETHNIGCTKSILFDTVDVYKITLKNGEKIEINTNSNAPKVYAVQENDYSISYSTDGKTYTNYVNDGSIYLSETTVAALPFTNVQNGTLTIKRTSVNAPADMGTNDTETTFPDVPKNSNYATAVEYVSKLGVMVGDDKGNFNPDKIVSRAEMATIVCRVLKQAENLPNTNVFNDVPATHWANAFIGKASELGIVGGYGGGKFGPGDPVTYEQAATMIIRAIGEEDKANSYGGYPNGHLLVAQEKNLLEGIQAVQGQGLVRSSVAVLLYNYYTNLNNPSSPDDGHVHNWETRSVAEVGHYENNGTHKVTYYTCSCGFYLNSDNPNWKTLWQEHKKPITGCKGAYEYIVKEVPNDPQYVIDTPAHDETYCTICGAIK